MDVELPQDLILRKKGRDLIKSYIQVAMRHARYEIVRENGTYYGEIRECPGVHAAAASLKMCKNQLEEALEEWILVNVDKNMTLPPIDNIEIRIKRQVNI